MKITPKEDLFQPVKWLKVDSKEICFEDGRSEHVPEFFILREPVNVKCYRNFCEATGYRTQAEQQNSPENYLQNTVTDMTSARDLGGTPAFSLSYLDACAFCEWSGFSLPTEAQWLAAAISSDIRFPMNPFSLEFQQDRHTPHFQQFLRLQQNLMDKLHVCGSSWIASDNDSDYAILRSGPFLALYDGWEKDIDQHRKICRKTDYFIENPLNPAQRDGLFHVCRTELNEKLTGETQDV